MVDFIRTSFGQSLMIDSMVTPLLWYSYFHIFDNMGNKPSDLQHIINIYGLLGFLQGLIIPISCLYCIWMNSPKRKQHKYSILSYWIFLWLFCLYCIWMNSPKGRQKTNTASCLIEFFCENYLHPYCDVHIFNIW